MPHLCAKKRGGINFVGSLVLLSKVNQHDAQASGFYCDFDIQTTSLRVVLIGKRSFSVILWTVKLGEHGHPLQDRHLGNRIGRLEMIAFLGLYAALY